MYRTDNFIPSVHAELRRISHDNEMKCPRCNENYAVIGRDPRLLSCLHAICRACAEEHGDLHDVRCPTCLASDVGGGRSPPDYPRLNELILHALKHNPDQVVCSYRRDGGKAKKYCFRCGHFLCNQCQRFHVEMELAKNHKIVDIGELVSYTLDEWKLASTCPEHPDYPVTSYCRESACRKLICLLCSTTEHAEHYTQRIDDAYETEKNNLKNVSQQLTDIIPALKTRLPRREKAEDMRARIRAAFEKLRVTVTERHEHHRKMLDQHYGEFQTGADENRSKLKDDLETAMSFYDQAMAFTSDPKYRELEGSVPTDAKFSVPKNPDSHLVFVQVGLANLLQDIQSYGKVNTSPH